MSLPSQPILVDGAWRQAESPTGGFPAFKVSTGEAIAGEDQVSGRSDIETMLEAGREAGVQLMHALPETVACLVRARRAFSGPAREHAAV